MKRVCVKGWPLAPRKKWASHNEVAVLFDSIDGFDVGIVRFGGCVAWVDFSPKDSYDVKNA